MVTTTPRSPAVVLVATGLALLACASAARAQFIGPNPGVMLVSPLGGEAENGAAPARSGAARRAERLLEHRLARLEPVRRRLEAAAEAAEMAQKEAVKGTSREVRRWTTAVRRAESARRRLDVLSRLYVDSEGFQRAARELGFELRKVLSEYKRGLRRAKPEEPDTDAAKRADAEVAPRLRADEAGSDPDAEARRESSSRPTERPASRPSSRPSGQPGSQPAKREASSPAKSR